MGEEEKGVNGRRRRGCKCYKIEGDVNGRGEKVAA